MRGSTTGKLRVLGVEDVRETNELKFLHLIRDKQPISRADLAKATGLRAGTVSVIVNRLLKAGVINEGQEAPSSGGRPATYLQVNAEKAYVVGISIGVHQTTYAISDFNGRILNQRTMHTGPDPRQFLKRLGKHIAGFMETNFKRQGLAAVAVSIPGLIDRAEGTVLMSPNLGWTNIPVSSVLEEELGVPVHIENDANAASLSELWYGPMDVWSVHTILFILVVEGIGTGLIVNGEIYTGSRLGIGGFGHLPIDPLGPRCSCGNIGCWESMASDEATMERFRASCKEPAPQLHNLQDLIALAQAGDGCARRELLTTASLLGRGIRGLAHGLAPDTIVIGGQIASAWTLIEPALQHEMRSKYFITGISQPILRPATVEQPSLFGAIPVALRSVLHPRKRAHPSS